MVHNYFKKRMLFFVLSFIIVGFITITSTYAIMNSDFKNGTSFKVNNNNLEVSYIHNQKELNILNYPLNKYDGFNTSTSNVIKVSNKSNSDTSYKIYLEETSGNNLDLSKMYYSINDNVYMLTSDGLLTSNTLKGKKEDILDIKVWMNSDLFTNEDMGKSLTFNLKVTE